MQKMNYFYENKFKNQEQKSKINFKFKILIMELNEPSERIFNFDERLVRFAGESIFFC
jgi:hypothetical protein